MDRRLVAATLLTFAAGTMPAQAAETPVRALEAAAVGAAALPGPLPRVAPPPARVPPPARGSAQTARPPALPALYVSLGALQAYDVYSTLGALERGAVEANPLMRDVVGRPVAFAAVKAGVTGVSIYAAERLWRDGKRVHAVLLMAAANGAMAYVAQHNARVLSGVR